MGKKDVTFMKICLITNPKSGSSDKSLEFFSLIEQHPDITVFETKNSGDAQRFARQAINDGFDLVVAAGGDGTINHVVNGIAPDFDKITLGIIPLGTGNDLARTLDIPFDPLAALELLLTGEKKTIDLLKLDYSGKNLYCINVASGGFSGQVRENISDEQKKNWGPLSYLIGAIATIPDITGYETRISYENGAEEQINILNIIVANCRTVGGGVNVAPVANPEDGLLDVITVKYDTALKTAGVLAQLALGNYINNAIVNHRRAKAVRISAMPGMWFSVDGELISEEANVLFTLIPRAINVIVGNAYTPVVTYEKK